MSDKRIRKGHPFRTGLLIAILALMITATLAGCSDGKKQPPGPTDEQPTAERVSSVSETRQGDVIYRLIVEQPDEKMGGKPKLWAELEYVGDNDEMTIYHAASPFFFFLKETTRGYDVGYSMNQPLITTVLKRGEPFKEVYDGGGGYTEKESQAYIGFLNELNKNGFPTGKYEASGYADFYTEEDGKKQDYKIEANVTFAVDQ